MGFYGTVQYVIGLVNSFHKTIVKHLIEMFFFIYLLTLIIQEQKWFSNQNVASIFTGVPIMVQQNQ